MGLFTTATISLFLLVSHILISHSPALYPMSTPDAPAPLLGNGWTHLTSFDDLDDDEYEHEEVCLFLPPPSLFHLYWLSRPTFVQTGSIRDSGSWDHV